MTHRHREAGERKRRLEEDHSVAKGGRDIIKHCATREEEKDKQQPSSTTKEAADPLHQG